MKTNYFALIKYEADENKVFDWKEPRFTEDENGNQIQEHLNAKILYIGANDTIENYVEVDENGIITELAADEATLEDYTAALAELGVM
jgi:hypothetical protein